MKSKRVFYIVLHILLIFCFAVSCLLVSCATTKGAGGSTDKRSEDTAYGGPGFRLFGTPLPVNTSELIGGVVVLVIILVSVIIIRQIMSKKK